MVKDLPVDDRLDGVSDYDSWKPRVMMTLEENNVKDFALKQYQYQMMQLNKQHGGRVMSKHGRS